MSTSLIPAPVETIANAVTADDLLALWHTHLAALVAAYEISIATVATYKAGMRKFMDWMSSNPQTVTCDTIRAFKAHLLTVAKPGAVNTWLAGVRAFYGWANGAKYMAYNPCSDVKGASRRGTTKGHKRDALTNSEMRSLLALHLPAREKAIIALKAFCGLRDVEIVRADHANMGTKDGETVLYVTGKGHNEADEFAVIANPAAQDALQVWLSERGPDAGPLFMSASDRNKNGRLSLSFVRGMVKAAFVQAGIHGERKTSHSIRHTAISNVIRNGGNILQAQKMARHANITTTQVYLHEIDRVSNAGEKLVDYSGGK
jgi:integrase/recombinase XerD